MHGGEEGGRVRSWHRSKVLGGEVMEEQSERGQL